jgi:hypothetical protein
MRLLLSDSGKRMVTIHEVRRREMLTVPKLLKVERAKGRNLQMPIHSPRFLCVLCVSVFSALNVFSGPRVNTKSPQRRRGRRGIAEV